MLLLLLTLQTLDDASFEKWYARVAPTKEELQWMEIPWRATFWDAVVEATKDDKPILLWAMNGHPLACT